MPAATLPRSVRLRLDEALASGGGVAEVLGGVLDLAIEVTRADRGNVQIVHPRDGGLRIVAHRGFTRRFLQFFRFVKRHASACSAALRRRRPVIVSDVRRSRVYTGATRQAMLDADALACVSVPIVSKTGDVLGIVSTHFRTPHRPTTTELARLTALAREVGARNVAWSGIPARVQRRTVSDMLDELHRPLA